MISRIDKNAIKFSLLKSKIQRELGNLKELSSLVERSLHRQSKALAGKLEEKSIGLSKSEKQELAGWYADDFIQLHEIFPRIQRYALFTSTMATVEANVVALCHAMHSIMGLPKEFRKPKQNVVSHALKYLEKQALVDFSRFSHYAGKVDMFRRIRNCVVHSEGKNTDPQPDELREYCADIPTIEIDSKDRIILRQGFVEVVFHTAGLFFDRLFQCSREAWTGSTSRSGPRLTARLIDNVRQP